MSEGKEVTAKILKQVEFYFSDSNLPRDKFLKGLVDKDPEGWVEIATIASFARMKSLSTDNEVVVNAIKSSPSLLQVSEDGTKVKRTAPLPENFSEKQSENSCYAKGFKEDTTLDAIEEFINSNLKEGEKLNAIRMRRMPQDKKFKGSVFLEFSSKDTAERVAALTLTFTGQEEPLLMMTKTAYVEKKKAERDTNNTKKRKQTDSEDTKEEVKERPIVSGLIFHISGLNEEASRETIKDCFEGIDVKVAFVEYSRGRPEGYVRIDESSGVKGSEAMAEIDKKAPEICGVKPTIKALEGEEETKYWTKLRSEQNNKKKGGKGGKKFQHNKKRRN
jgi:lupus La protein